MTPERAFEVLGLEKDTATEQSVKRAFRHLAMTTHPDAGGSDQAMAELNAAHDVALTALGAGEPERCVCRGFVRNPLCKAHGKFDAGVHKVEDLSVECSTCGGTRKVRTGSSWSSIDIACPDCTIES